MTWLRGSRAAGVGDVIAAWQSDAAFQTLFGAALARAEYQSFRWETPPVVAGGLGKPFECVVLDDPSLGAPADPGAFAEQFARNAGEVVTFPNLGRDATLVVPCPSGDPSAYGHLAAFVRHAPRPQVTELWRAVGDAMVARVGDHPVWLSTAGAGVPWLHVRLDDRPKYYRHAPYRARP